MTRREAAIIGAYTGVLIGDFADLHAYIEEKFARPVWTHELTRPEIVVRLKTLAAADVAAIKVEP